MRRITDITIAFILLIILSPLMIACAIIIYLADGSPIFYKQIRIGRFYKPFEIFKFRTMLRDSAKNGLLTTGKDDPRITRSGLWLRALKLDEIPQLFNVILGDMSLVGPRPEVKKYVQLFPEEYKKLLTVRPGITSPASIQFRNEHEYFFQKDNPEEYYIQTILPEKIKIDLTCVQDRSLRFYFNVLLSTITHLFVKQKTLIFKENQLNS